MLPIQACKPNRFSNNGSTAFGRKHSPERPSRNILETAPSFNVTTQENYIHFWIISMKIVIIMNKRSRAESVDVYLDPEHLETVMTEKYPSSELGEIADGKNSTHALNSLPAACLHPSLCAIRHLDHTFCFYLFSKIQASIILLSDVPC